MSRSIRNTSTLCAAGVLCVLLAGCRHQAPVNPPTQAQAPAAEPAPAAITVVTPLPSIPPDAKPTNVKSTDAQPTTTDAQPVPAPVVQKPRKRFHRTRPAVAENSATPAASSGAGKEASSTGKLQNAVSAQTGASQATTVAGVSPSPPGTPGPSYNSSAAEEAAPALGQLSTGGAASQPARVRLLAETQSLEARLARIKQTVAGDAASVRMQVQVFLKRAKEAVEESDLDGAQTLNTKARVLLGELETQS